MMLWKYCFTFDLIMPRNPPRKTNIGTFTDSNMREAVQLVIDGQKLRKAAAMKNVKFQTLARYVKKQRANPDVQIRMTPNYEVRKVFTCQQEALLGEYLIKCSKIFYGLPLIECRKLAYEMAVENNLKMSDQWVQNHMAGKEWMIGFMRRNPLLSIRTPEGCSLSRATSFNIHNVGLFFDNLECVMRRNKNFSDGTRIFNLDETSTMTVQRTERVVAEKGARQVSSITSGERGTLVTTCCIISAAGNSLPPAMVFPRVHFKEHMLVGAPSGTIGLATPSGWMNADLFLRVMQHYIHHTKSSKDNPTLLIYDNHESHLSIAVLDLSKENGVTILTVPPHSTNKLQPLDVAVLKPFSDSYNAAVNSWLMHHPGKPFSIYEVASCVGIAHRQALTPSNIISAFAKTGIFPFNRNVFTDTDFLPSSVTDRPLELGNEGPSEPRNNQVLSGDSSTSNSHQALELGVGLSIPSTSNDQTLPGTPSSDKSTTNQSPVGLSKFVSPEDIRGFPKAGARKNTQKRRKGKSMIATDTPQKNELEERKKKGKVQKSRPKPKPKESRRILFEDTSDEEEPAVGDMSSSSSDDNWPPQLDPSGFEELDREPCVNDYVLIELLEEKSRKKLYFVGKLIKNKDDTGDYEVSYMRRSKESNVKFNFPDVPDLKSIHESSIKTILPPPNQGQFKLTKRQKTAYSFEVDFGLLNGLR